MIDLDTIKDHRPCKGPEKLGKSEKDEAIRHYVWGLRWQKRQQHRVPVRKSYIGMQWAADGSAGLVWVPKYEKGMSGLWYRLDDFKWWGYHRRSILNDGIAVRFKAATRLASDKAGV